MKELEVIESSLNGLKDFQKATVEKIYSILNNESNNQNRFLVADEVGLGKTLIAKGIISKFAKKFLEEGKEKLKVVYICSNQAIASQNLRSLRVFEDDCIEEVGTGRLTMLPVKHESKEGYIKYSSLTPDTSLTIKEGSGTWRERIIIVALLERVEEFKKYKNQLKKSLRKNKSLVKWESVKVNGYLVDVRNNLNEEIVDKFIKEINEEKELVKEIISEIENNNDISNKNLKELRRIIVKSSIDTFEPDIVILDEFQRFRTLISEENEEIQIISKKFFDRKNQKTVLLSATPYKLYSTAEELKRGEEHFKEFKEVIKFLFNDSYEYGEFEKAWDKYKDLLSQLNTDEEIESLEIKQKAEELLGKVMCRTERFMVSNSGNGLVEDKLIRANVTKEEIDGYIRCDNLNKKLEELNEKVYAPMEFYKSVPFMYSFMDRYKLKRVVEKNSGDEIMKKALKKNKKVFINKNNILKYEKLDYANSRFRIVVNNVFEKNGENLLWVPPSMPYYKLRGPFKDSLGFSKSLIFSSWEMVPRMMASLISYESERKTIGNLEKKYKYFEDGKTKIRRLVYRGEKIRGGKVETMTNFILLYPSEYLSNAIDFKKILLEKANYREIKSFLRKKFEKDINKLNLAQIIDKESNVVDKTWYYILPVILDYSNNKDSTNNWIKKNKENMEMFEERENRILLNHFIQLSKLFKQYLNGKLKLGKMPKDLIDVMTDMTLGSPGIIAKRVLRDIFGGKKETEQFIWDKAFELGEEFRSKFGETESAGILDNLYIENREYWRKVLKYCSDGNLQAVLDEYSYLIYENWGLNKKANIIDRIRILIEKISEGMGLRNSSFKIDTLGSLCKDESEKISMRTNYSVSFSHKSNSEKSEGRTDDVRLAFNSPFRPFVLSTTSIGQEGLDFHWYCRKIIHWNLPSNPVELEQREGRINRYKGLVIRQNLAKNYDVNNIKYKENTIEMWNNVFEKSEDKKKAINDLVPYWMLANDNKKNTIKIERIVPYYPYSKDIEKFKRLINILTVYRLSLGQPNQEELIKVIGKVSKERRENLYINLAPITKMD